MNVVFPLYFHVQKIVTFYRFLLFSSMVPVVLYVIISVDVSLFSFHVHVRFAEKSEYQVKTKKLK